MANSRLARFVTEVAPPQFVSVMRYRTSKVLDTIKEEEREYSNTTNDYLISSSSSKGCACSTSSPPRFASAASGATAAGTETRYFFKEVHRAFSMFGH